MISQFLNDSPYTQSVLVKFQMSRKPASIGNTGMMPCRERFYKEVNVVLGSKPSAKNTVKEINKILNSRFFLVDPSTEYFT